MATKARHLKTPMQLWVRDNRKRLGLSSADLAAWTDVSVDTARGWESRGRPSQDAIDILTVKFGVPPPPEAGPAGMDTLPAGLVALMENLIEEQRETRAMLERVLSRLAGEADPVGDARRSWVEEEMAREATRSPLPTPSRLESPARTR